MVYAVIDTNIFVSAFITKNATAPQYAELSTAFLQEKSSPCTMMKS